jgi:peptidyl serine alpha-galactosyltransferase
MWWQAEFLHYTYSIAGMHSELTALVAASGEQEREFTCNTVPVANYADSVPGLPLRCLNKPGGIAQWAALDGPREETILIVDPDSVFVRPVCDPGPILANEAYSEQHDYMSPDIPGSRIVLHRHCREEVRAKVQPVGIYILINRACLAELARHWLNKSIDIAADSLCRDALDGTGWLSDMWGYTIAAAELGIHHHIRDLSQVTGADSLRNPITHYCYPLMRKRDGPWQPNTRKPVLWSKWSYQPWDDPPDPTDATQEGQLLLERLRGLIIARNSGKHEPQSMESR